MKFADTKFDQADSEVLAQNFAVRFGKRGILDGCVITRVFSRLATL